MNQDSAQVVLGEDLALNRELATGYGVTITLISKPGGTAVLVRRRPEDIQNGPDFYHVTLAYQTPAGEDYTPAFVIAAPSRDDNYEAAFFAVEPPAIKTAFIVPVRHAGPVIGFTASSPMAEQGVIGLG